MAFSGVSNLRGSNESVPIERWQLDEIRKCVEDPIYFITTYMKINTKDFGMQLFKLYDFQKNAITKFDKYRFNILKFPRQSGKCFCADEIIHIKNSAGVEMELTIGEFFDLLHEEHINE
jgi:hypothetical protein